MTIEQTPSLMPTVMASDLDTVCFSFHLDKTLFPDVPSHQGQGSVTKQSEKLEIPGFT
jgi:hypothetical protein